MATLNLGNIKFNWKGLYSAGTAYVVDDVVQYADTGVTSSYICVAASTGNAPSSGGTVDTTYWSLMAKGTDAVSMAFNAKITGDGTTVTDLGSAQGYFVDTSSAKAILKLPASPSLGDQIVLTDYAKTFHTNRCEIQRNGNLIEGSADDWTFVQKGLKVTMTFESNADSTSQGWKITTFTHDDYRIGSPLGASSVGSNKYMVATSDAEEVYMDGDYMVHKFDTSGTWKCLSVGTDSTYGDKIEYLIIGGGGSGGTHYAGGGGAGGYRANNAYDHTVTAQDYTITVGAGGGERTQGNNHGNKGSNTDAFGMTSEGGGGGGANGGRGQDGGSGGGSGHGHTHGNATGNGTGHRGGNHQSHNTGGGGGAHRRGSDQHSNHASGHGGRGEQNDITGQPKWYAGGGGGAGHNHTSEASGGIGGGGCGGGGWGKDGTGGGGGGTEGPTGQVHYGGGGGDGIVIVRYKVKD